MEQLAPVPDFRYVGLLPGAQSRGEVWAAAVIGAVTSTCAAAGCVMGARAVAVGALALGVGALASLRAQRSGAVVSGPCVAIVPWGVLVDDQDQPRALRWAAVRRVHVETAYGRDEATSTTRSSLVTIETERETFAGRAFGAVAIERLLAHLDAYAEEQAHAIALDLDGQRRGEGPLEPDCEVLIAAAHEYIESAPGSSRLDLPGMGYRTSFARASTDRTVAELRAVLRDRRPRDVDPRPFAGVVAAELGAVELIDDLLALAQSPHPLVAAVAKQAARKLGAPTARTGTLSEVSPFLLVDDARSLAAWAGTSD